MKQQAKGSEGTGEKKGEGTCQLGQQFKHNPPCNRLWGPSLLQVTPSLQLGSAAEDHAGKSLGELIPLREGGCGRAWLHVLNLPM